MLIDAGDAPTRQTPGGAVPLDQQQVNYIRNSVKATVDAYDGTVTLYAWDEAGPGAEGLAQGVPDRP